MEPTDQELQNMHWRDRWDYEAGRAYEALAALTEDELLEHIRRDETGLYFQVWDAIAEKGTVEKAAPVLWDFLQRTPGEDRMLDRYHCAAALFRILDMPDPECENELRKRVQWDHDGESARQQALLELAKIISSKQRRRR